MKTSVLLFTLAGLLAASAVTVTTWPAVEVRTSARRRRSRSPSSRRDATMR